MQHEIINLYDSGESTRQIARSLNVSQAKVCRVLKKNNIKGRPRRINKKLESIIFNKYLSGESSELIAQDVGVSASTVCRVVKRLGGEIRIPVLNKRKVSRYNTSSIVFYKSKELSSTYLNTLSQGEKDEVADFLFGYFRKHGFPYPNYTDNELNDDFKRLVKSCGNIDGNIINSRGEAGLKIFKHYNQHYFFVSGSVGSKKSMIECFNDDDKLMKVIKNRVNNEFNITGNMLRQGMRTSWTAFGASIFRPELAKTIYREFTNPSSIVLDISAGFGQRMLGAHFVKQYIGLDPWTETICALERIKDRWNLPAVLHNIGSEYFNPSLKVDFCFSSPPFFNKEIYSLDKTQAYNTGFKNYLNWWQITINNVDKMLKPRGFFVVNMSKNLAPYLIRASKYSLNRTLEITYSRSHMSTKSSDCFYVLRKPTKC